MVAVDPGDGDWIAVTVGAAELTTPSQALVVVSIRPHPVRIEGEPPA